MPSLGEGVEEVVVRGEGGISCKPRWSDVLGIVIDLQQKAMRAPSTAPGEGCGGSASGSEAALCLHSRWSADGNSAAAIEGRATPAYSTSSRAPPPVRQFGILSPGHAHETP